MKHLFSFRVSSTLFAGLLVLFLAGSFSLSAAEPQVVGVGSLLTTNVSVVFSQEMESASATEITNYIIGGGVTVLGAALESGTNVTLLTTVIGSGDYTITVRNVRDNSVGHLVVVTTNLLFKTQGFQDSAVINNSQPSFAYSLGDDIVITGGGSDISGTADEFRYTYKEVTGNFDAKVRVKSLAHTDNFAKAGLMARLSLDANSRNVFMVTTPRPASALYLLQYRAATGGITVATQPRPPLGSEVWVRLRRIGSVFTSYYSNDGTNWVEYLTRDTAIDAEGAYPNSVLFGLAVSSGNTSESTTADFDNFTVIPFIPTPLQITVPPQDQTVLETQTATFTVEAIGTPPFYYQWQRNGADIPGANATGYTTPPVQLADDGARYQVIVVDLLEQVTSPAATLHVLTNTVLPSVFGVGSLLTTNVSVVFSQEMESASATEITNYIIGGGVTVLGAALESGTNVTLLTTVIGSGDYTITVRNVRDNSVGHLVVVTTNLLFKTQGFQDSAVINNSQPSFAYSLGDDIVITGGGSDISGTADEFRYTYKEVTGNFDAKVRVKSLAHTDNFAKAGLMARLSLDANSRNVFMVTTPRPASALYLLQYRAATGGITVATQPRPPLGSEVWVRLRRIGSVFTSYYSNDGTNWVEYLTRDTAIDAEGAYPNSVLFGLVVSSGNTSESTTADFDNFTVIPFIPTPLQITVPPQDQTVLETQTATFTVEAIGTPPFYYQWQRNGADIPGANATSYTTPPVQLADDGARYQVIVVDLLEQVTSPAATLHVLTNTVLPSVFGVGSLLTTNVSVVFSQEMESASATEITNYIIGGGVTVLGAALESGTNVTLLTTVIGSGDYTITVRNVRDNSVGHLVVVTTNLLFKTQGFQDSAVINNSQPSFAYSLGDDIVITGGGSDISGTADEFRYTYKEVTGNFDAKVRVKSLAHTDNFAKAGLMARLSLDANSRNVFMVTTPRPASALYLLQYRAATGGITVATQPRPPLGSEVWVRLRRIGSVFTSYYSNDGTNWVEYLTRDTAIDAEGAYPNSVLFGLAVSSGNTSESTTADFDNFGSFQAAPSITGISVDGNEVVISWPIDVQGFTLQSADSLTAPTQWTNVTAAVSNNIVRIPYHSPPQLFFRLKSNP